MAESVINKYFPSQVVSDTEKLNLTFTKYNNYGGRSRIIK